MKKVFAREKLCIKCCHCDDPACVNAYIAGAMTKDKKTGITKLRGGVQI